MKASKFVALLWVALLIGSLVVVPKEAKAEDTNWWVEKFPEVHILAVAPAPNGDIIVGGWINDTGAPNAWIARLNPSGRVKWQKKFIDENALWIESFTVTPSGRL